MRCPKCHIEISELGNKCRHCGHSFDAASYDRLALYLELAGEVRELKSCEARFRRGLESLSTKVERFGLALSRELETGVRGEPEGVEPELELDLDEVEQRLGLAKEPVIREEADMAGEPARPTPPGDAGEVPPDAIAKDATGRVDPWARAGRPGGPRGAGPGRIRKPPAEPGSFELRLGQKGLLVVGIVIMVFGIGFFLKYSFERGWIGPAGRVALAYLWGGTLLVAGNRFRSKDYEVFGLYLIGGGIAVLYAANYAAFQIYHLLDQPVAFLLMILVTVFSNILAVVYDTKWLAVLGLAGGFLTPVLLSTGVDNQIVLMSYMTILNLGVLGVAFYKRWNLVNILGFVCTYLLYAAWFQEHYQESKFWPALIFVNVFYLIYSLVPFVYQYVAERDDRISSLVIITPNSFIAFAFSYSMIHNRFPLHWVSVISILYAFVFLTMATYLYRREREETASFVILVAMTSLFLVITVPLIFSRQWITIFWAAQALALLWMGTRLNRVPLMAGAFLLMAVAVAKFLLHDYESVFRFRWASFHMSRHFARHLTERYVTILFMLGGLFAFARMVGAAVRAIPEARRPAGLPAVVYGVWTAVLFIILNAETSSFFQTYLGTARFAAISVLWTLFSVGLMTVGFRKNSPVLRRVSLALFGLTVAKVFFFDISRFSTPYRILSFVVLGLVLIGISYLYHKFKDRIILAVSQGTEKD